MMRKIILFSLILCTLDSFGQIENESRFQSETKSLIKEIFGDFEFLLYYGPQNRELINTLKEYTDTLIIKTTVDDSEIKIDTFITKETIDYLIEKANYNDKFVWTKDFFPNAKIKKRVKRNYFGLNSSLNYYQKKIKNLHSDNFNPYSSGIYLISKPVFTKDYKFAFISIDNYVGPLSAYGDIQIYIKIKGKWIYLKSIGGYIS